MAIDYTAELKNEIADKGFLLDTTPVGGDASGTIGNISVNRLLGALLQTFGGSAPAPGLGYRSNGTSFILETLLTEDSDFSGDVSGDQASGLTVSRIGGIPFELTSPAIRHTVIHNGSNYENRVLNSDDIDETASKKWLTTEAQTINGEKTFSNTVNIGGALYIDESGTPSQLAGKIAFGAGSGRVFATFSTGTKYIKAGRLVISSGGQLESFDEFRLNGNGGTFNAPTVPFIGDTITYLGRASDTYSATLDVGTGFLIKSYDGNSNEVYSAQTLVLDTNNTAVFRYIGSNNWLI